MAQIFYQPLTREFNDTGSIGAGFKYYFYTTGTTTAIPTYTTPALSVENPYPVVADSTGRFPPIWVSDLSTTKVELTDENDVVIYTQDPVGTTSATTSLNDLDVRPDSYWGLTTGTAAAYVLTANPSISAYSNVQTFSFQAHIENTINPTIAINGLSALNLKKYTGQGTKVGLQAGDLQPTQRYNAACDGVDIVVTNPRSLPLNIGTAPTLTITTGVVTITNVGSSYLLDTEGSTPTDNLDTINGGNDGEVICLGLVSAARKVNLLHGTGNIFSENLGNVGLTSVTQKVYLQYDATNAVWEILFNSFSQNVLQVVNTQTGATASGTTVMPYDDTIPQITEGDEYMTLAITPTSTTNKLKIDVVFYATASAADRIVAALFQDATANALCANTLDSSSASSPGAPINFTYYMTSGTTSSTTFRVRAGKAGAGTIFFNGVSAGRRLGGVLFSSITITEYSA